MTEREIQQVLDGYKAGSLTIDDALGRLRQLPFEDLGFATVDHHRSLRQGFPEVVFGQGKWSGRWRGSSRRSINTITTSS
jgi:NCAIR mutase (PurE)-related protein